MSTLVPPLVGTPLTADPRYQEMIDATALAVAAATPLDTLLERSLLNAETAMRIVSAPSRNPSGAVVAFGARWPDGVGQVRPGSGTTVRLTRDAAGAVTQIKAYHSPSDRTVVVTIPRDASGNAGVPTFAFETGDTNPTF